MEKLTGRMEATHRESCTTEMNESTNYVTVCWLPQWWTDPVTALMMSVSFLGFCWSPPSPTNHAQRPRKHAHIATVERQMCETFGRLIAHTFSEAPSTLHSASCQAKVSTNHELSLTLGCNILFLFILLFVFLLLGISREVCPCCLLPAACKSSVEKCGCGHWSPSPWL